MGYFYHFVWRSTRKCPAKLFVFALSKKAKFYQVDAKSHRRGCDVMNSFLKTPDIKNANNKWVRNVLEELVYFRSNYRYFSPGIYNSEASQWIRQHKLVKPL